MDFGPSNKRWALLLLISAAPMMACGSEGGDGPPAAEESVGSQPLSEQAQLLINQGNAAQRDGRYADALEAFSQALELYPDHSVPQFGCLMAAEALGDTALAQSLRKKLETTGPELLQMLGPGENMGGVSPSTQGGVHAPAGTLPAGYP
jgi:tetratricopeptide (TPR) repeat protein